MSTHRNHANAGAASLARALLVHSLLSPLASRGELSEPLMRACAPPAQSDAEFGCSVLNGACGDNYDCCGYEYEYNPPGGGGNGVQQTCDGGCEVDSALCDGSPPFPVNCPCGSDTDCEDPLECATSEPNFMTCQVSRH